MGPGWGREPLSPGRVTVFPEAETKRRLAPCVLVESMCAPAPLRAPSVPPTPCLCDVRSLEAPPGTGKQGACGVSRVTCSTTGGRTPHTRGRGPPTRPPTPGWTPGVLPEGTLGRTGWGVQSPGPRVCSQESQRTSPTPRAWSSHQRLPVTRRPVRLWGRPFLLGQHYPPLRCRRSPPETLAPWLRWSLSSCWPARWPVSQQDKDGTDTHVKDKGPAARPSLLPPSSAAQSCLISPGPAVSTREHSPAYLEVPVWGAFPTAPLPPSAGLLRPGPVAAFPLPTDGTQATEGCAYVGTVATPLTLGTSSPYTQGPSVPTRHPAAAPPPSAGVRSSGRAAEMHSQRPGSLRNARVYLRLYIVWKLFKRGMPRRILKHSFICQRKSGNFKVSSNTQFFFL